MRTLQLSGPDRSPRDSDHLLVFDQDDAVMESIVEFASDHGIAAARFSGIGAFGWADVGYFDRSKRDYDHHVTDIGHEVLSIVGNVALRDGSPRVHAHVTLGAPDGSARGGHLFEARVWPTLELVLTAYPARWDTAPDEPSGLALLDIAGCTLG